MPHWLKHALLGALVIVLFMLLVAVLATLFPESPHVPPQ